MNLFRRNKKMKDFINKEYINEQGDAVIDVILDNSGELFSPYSSKKMLNPKILNYIDSVADPIPNIYPLVINFVTDDVEKINQEAVRAALKRYYWFSYQEKARTIANKTLFSVIMFIFGITAFVFNVLQVASTKPFLIVLSNFSVLISWIFLWESIDHFMSGRKEYVLDRDNEKQMAIATVIFTKKEEYF